MLHLNDFPVDEFVYSTPRVRTWRSFKILEELPLVTSSPLSAVREGILQTLETTTGVRRCVVYEILGMNHTTAAASSVTRLLLVFSNSMSTSMEAGLEFEVASQRQ